MRSTNCGIPRIVSAISFSSLCAGTTTDTRFPSSTLRLGVVADVLFGNHDRLDGTTFRRGEYFPPIEVIACCVWTALLISALGNVQA